MMATVFHIRRHGHACPMACPLIIKLCLLWAVIFPCANGAPSSSPKGASSDLKLSNKEQIIIEDPEDRKMPVEGGELVLNCFVKNRRGEVQWVRDGFALGVDPELNGFDRYKMAKGGSDDFSLHINSVTIEDDAKFHCQVGRGDDGSLEKKSKEITVDVQVPPRSPSIVQQGPKLGTPSAGRKVEVQCVTIGKPKPRVTWYNDTINQEIRSSDIIDDETEKLMSDGKLWEVRSMLRFTLTKNHHGQNLTCSALNSASDGIPRRTSTTLDVKYPPILTVMMVPERIKEFDDVLLKCSADANPSDVRYQWIVDGERVKNQMDDSLLLLKNVPRTMTNVFIQCLASNEVGTATAIAPKLDIRYGPRFKGSENTSIPRISSAKEGTTVKLQCDDVDSNPDPSYEWTYGSYPRVLGTQKTLEIPALNRRKAGSYFCNVTVTGFTSVRKEYSVVLQDKPRIESNATQYGHVDDEVVHVVCNGFAAPNLSSVEWYFHGEKLQTSGDPRYNLFYNQTEVAFWSVLEIFSASEEDFGEYNCTVRNELGSDSLRIVLKSRKRLPLLTILTGAVVVLIVIIIGCTCIMVFIIRRKRNASQKSYDEEDKAADDDAWTDLYGRKPFIDNIHNSKSQTVSRVSISGNTILPSRQEQEEDMRDDTSSYSDSTNNKEHFYNHRQHNFGSNCIKGGTPAWETENLLNSTALSDSTLQDGDDITGRNFWPRTIDQGKATKDPSLHPTAASSVGPIGSDGPTAADPRFCAAYGNPHLSRYGLAASSALKPPNVGPPSGNSIPYNFQQQPPDLIIQYPADFANTSN